MNQMDDLTFVCNYEAYNADTTSSILPPHNFPEGTEVNPTVWTAIQDNRHVEEPKKTKTRIKKKKVATPSATAPISQEATEASNNMDVDQRARSSATLMPMTPQPAVRLVDALGRAANALPTITSESHLPTATPQQEKDWDQGLTPEERARQMELYRKDLNWPTTNGPQRPGGNNPVPPIDSLDKEAQIALVMLNTHYNSYVGANNCRQFAVTEMHLRQRISAQETL
ncbi:hypothetical protein PCASD_21387 [Puccinia coronata f. sp. avenae]|uniref:Uncharacterized protein n=1 Tax=Puccinia coronata f. sp. avenae TaxID=200324 RepID=A0A2N5SHG2_9BASI|nr:hypothetical protein PCASD_21387 [Puccinia coronata f. sp. avenae]